MMHLSASPVIRTNTNWLTDKHPEPPLPGAPGRPPFAANLMEVVNYAAWLGMAVCAAGFMICAVKMASTYRHGDGEGNVFGVGWVMLACLVIGSASGLVNAYV